MKKICFRCKKEIVEDTDHFEFVEYSKNKMVNVDFAHKDCWNDFLKRLSSVETAQNFLSRINTKPLEAMGLMKPQEQVVII